MDTMDLHLTIGKDQSLDILEEINWIDLYILNMKENKYRLKIHVPLYFCETNAYLVQTQKEVDRKSTRLNSSHRSLSRMPSPA